MILTTALVQAAESEGLTIGRILADIPHDAPAILLYVLTAASIGLIWWANRKKTGDDSAVRSEAPGAAGAAGAKAADGGDAPGS